MGGAAERIHATAVGFSGQVAVIRGPSGSGKSDLALRCLGLAVSPLMPQTVQLVADDQVLISRTSAGPVASAPAQIAGRLEVRGVGIVEMENTQGPVRLLVDLCPQADMPRLPDPWPTAVLLGFRIPILKLWPFAASAPLVLAVAMRRGDIPPVMAER